MAYKTTSAVASLVGSTVASYQPISSVAGQASDGVCTVITALLDRLSKYEDVSLIDNGCASVVTGTDDLIVAVNGTPNATGTTTDTPENTDAQPTEPASDASATTEAPTTGEIPAGAITATSVPAAG